MRRLFRWARTRLRRLVAPHAGALPAAPAPAAPRATPDELLEMALLSQLERTLAALPSTPGTRDARVITSARFGRTLMKLEVRRADSIPARPDQRHLGARRALQAQLRDYFQRCKAGDWTETRTACADVEVHITLGWSVLE